MVAVAQMVVWEIGLDNLPYFHEHVWLTEGREYAVVELMDWQRETQEELHVTLKVFKWWVRECPDIGV